MSKMALLDSTLLYYTLNWLYLIPLYSVADPGGVRGVQMHPPLAASNVFLRT